MHRYCLYFVIIARLVVTVLTATHDLIIGTFSHGKLFTVRFDDEALTLHEVGATSVPYSNSWISLSASQDLGPCPLMEDSSKRVA